MGRAFRDSRKIAGTEVLVREHTDARLDEYEAIHDQFVTENPKTAPILRQAIEAATWGSDQPRTLEELAPLSSRELIDILIKMCAKANLGKNAWQAWPAIWSRLLLSEIVDADHGNAAQHEGEMERTPPEPRWEERLEILQRKVKKLAEKKAKFPRTKLRKKLFKIMSECDVPENAITTIFAHLGTGKTLSAMVLALRTAIRYGARHIFVVLPYCSIISQNVDVYQKMLTLPGEKRAEVVAEHDSMVDFRHDKCLKHMTVYWESPIIVTTSVQFFGTMASDHPSKLRKYHHLPGSVIILDETQDLLPHYCWPQALRWMEDLTVDYGCRFILASAAMPKFWTLPEFCKKEYKFPELVPEALQQEMRDSEKKRIRWYYGEKFASILDLVRFVLSKPGPRMIVMNTVAGAAMVALLLHLKGYRTLHLSSALSGISKVQVIRKIKRLIRERVDFNLVTTSCVQAGMDFSLRSGFRERCSLSSMINLGGRLNRNQERRTPSSMWDFVQTDMFINRNPEFDKSIRALDGLTQTSLGELESSPETLLTEAFELLRANHDNREEKERHERIIDAEQACEFDRVCELFKIINSDTRLVVTDRRLAEKLRNQQPVDYRTLHRRSVQMFADVVVEKYKLENLSPSQDKDLIYAWRANDTNVPQDLEYGFWETNRESPNLGYWKGIFKTLRPELLVYVQALAQQE